jgi:hypothetical protein
MSTLDQIKQAVTILCVTGTAAIIVLIALWRGTRKGGKK